MHEEIALSPAMALALGGPIASSGSDGPAG